MQKSDKQKSAGSDDWKTDKLKKYLIWLNFERKSTIDKFVQELRKKNTAQIRRALFMIFQFVITFDKF